MHQISQKDKRLDYIIVLAILIYSIFLLIKIDTFPNVFLDEGNGMYDSWCISHFGVDSNLIKNPIYLPSYAGQGQSVLYPYIAGISMQLFGYKLWAYRLPIVMISIINYILLILLTHRKFGCKSALIVAVVIGTSPWLLTVSRWGMDCNIAPFMASIGTLVLFIGYVQLNNKKKKLIIICGTILLGLVAYSYNVGWMYLPCFLIVLLFWLIKLKKINPKELILPMIVLLIVIYPILVFAIRSNIPNLNTDYKIFWWTSPQLLVGRVKASFISFDGNIVKNIFNNLFAGIEMYLKGTDGLPWNSVGNIGPYYMFTFPVFLIGLITMIKRKDIQDIFILSALIGMIPIMMVVTPNYNHWIFLHFPVLLTISVGFVSLISSLANINTRRIFTSAVLVTYVVFSIFFGYQYFKLDRYTGWEISAINTIQSLKTENYSKIYFASDNNDFLYFIRTAIPVSPYKFQKTKDDPYSKVKLKTKDHYLNYERINSSLNISHHNSLLIVESSQREKFLLLTNNLRILTNFKLAGMEYYVYLCK